MRTGRTGWPTCSMARALYAGDDFAVTQMSGRVYAKYFPEFDCTVMMYCLAPNMDTVDECDMQALQKAQVLTLQ